MQKRLSDYLHAAAKSQQARNKQQQEKIRVGRPNFHKSTARQKQAVTETGDLTTEALSLWKTPDYLAYFIEQIGAGKTNFKIGGDAGKRLGHMKRFLAVMQERAAAPRSICLVLHAVAVTAESLRIKWKLKNPVSTWTLFTMTDQILDEFSHLIYDESSPQYLLTENVDVQELLIQESSDGWLIILSNEKVLRITNSETDRILNPKLRRRLGLSSSQQADGDLPILDFVE